jgi:hypothetical protein
LKHATCCPATKSIAMPGDVPPAVEIQRRLSSLSPRCLSSRAAQTGVGQPLPNTTGIYARPMQTAWELGAMALMSRRDSRLYDELNQLSSRLASVEKAQAARGKAKDQS